MDGNNFFTSFFLFLVMQLPFMIRVVLTLLVLPVIFSCARGNVDNNNAKTQNDTLAINVAVYPSLDALPLMLGNDWGVLDSLGVAVKIHVYRSQIDAEKALAEGKVDVAMSDLFRVGWWQWQKKPVRFAFVTRRRMNIVPNKALRITNVAQLDDRMIALARFSLDDYYCDKLEAMLLKKKGQILRPQINSVELRAKMLESGQLDAAVLGQQQTYKVNQRKFAELKVATDITDGFAGFAFNTNSYAVKHKRRQMRKLYVAYNIAANKIRKMRELHDISETTKVALFLDAGTLSRIKPKEDFMLAGKNKFSFAEEAVDWLKKRGAVGESYNGDTIVVE